MGRQKQLFYQTFKENVMTMERVRNDHVYEIPMHELHQLAPDITWKNPPVITPNLSPVEVCRLVGDWYLACSDDERRYNTGQFFTHPIVASYMAKVAGPLHDTVRILDAGAGVGILACAVCEAAIKQQLSAITIVAYESDPVLHTLCLFTLGYARDVLRDHNIEASIKVHHEDFVEAMAASITHTSLWSQSPQPAPSFDLAILNPPYFKVNQKDPRAKLVKDIATGRTNMYTIFMSLAASALRIDGSYVSITPRSFASGAYFKDFRHQFFTTITPELIHIFESRRSAFEDAEVLQENIILKGTKKAMLSISTPFVTISRSRGLADLSEPLHQQVERVLIVDDKQEDPVLHLPMSDIDTHLLQAFAHWNNRLTTFGLEISTGPVVPFRHLDTLAATEDVKQGQAVPLLWLQHIRRMQISWPLEDFDKPQGVLHKTGQKLLVRNTTLIILRRFSAKEEPRRITAAVLPEGCFGTELIGLENHLNYLYCPDGHLTHEEALGITAFLNSSLVDRYFRIANGNTQVSATELRKLPLPPWECFKSIGKRVASIQSEQNFDEIESIVMHELAKDLVVGNEEEDLQLPILKDSRIPMGKIQDAQRILRELGLPTAQQNEISALTLLALCNLDEASSWTGADQEPITIHNMMGFMKQHYGRAYAENTREVVRRQVVHQFEQARLVDRNPDDPTRPTNSPNTCYALTGEALKVFAQFGTQGWEVAIAQFLAQHRALWEQYQQGRQIVALHL